MATDINRDAHANRLRAIAAEVKTTNSPEKISECVAEIAYSMALLIDGNLATKSDIPKQPCPWHDKLKERHDNLEQTLHEHKQAAQPVIDDWQEHKAALKRVKDGFLSGVGSRLAWALVAGLISGIVVLVMMMIAFKAGNL